MIQTFRMFVRNVSSELKPIISDCIAAAFGIAIIIGVPICFFVGLYTLTKPYFFDLLWGASCAAMLILAYKACQLIYKLAVYLRDEWDYARECQSK